MYFEGCPFETGRRYAVKHDMTFLNHGFRQGEIVEFTGHGHELKLGIHRFYFKNRETSDENAWHVFDDDDTNEEDWIQHFELMKD
jgi:hypothetical protein